MLRKIGRILIGILMILLVVGIIFAILGVITIRRSFPKTNGEITLSQLRQPVDIKRDKFGVPHIYASNLHDLFYSQGYIHAQDRFWQMDFWRHIGSGRLSEMFGESQIETDKVLRTLGWARVVEKELQSLDQESLLILEAYAQGVNAYLADHKSSDLSLEYAILKLINPSYSPELWLPLHSLTWAKAMAWDLGGNMDEEIERAILYKSLTSEQIDEIFPAYPADHPFIIPGIEQTNLQNHTIDSEDEVRLLWNDDLDKALETSRKRLTMLDTILGPRGAGIGSNNWVISGQRTVSGKPLLVNDPHLGIQMPSIWYEIGLHCEPKNLQCPFEVTGFSFAGAPGVVIGHNNQIAWGFTNVGPDVQDLFIEKVNPENPGQYEVNGAWVDFQKVNETIRVAGDDPVELEILYTRHGPVISSTYLPDNFSDSAGIDLPPEYAISLCWTALQPSHTFPALWKMNLAQNWEEFRQAVSQFDVPSQNMVYADVQGNIGYQTPGRIPIRSSGDGLLPKPGWNDEYEWIGEIPFEELPNVFNPPAGFIATANNAVVSPGYPYLISKSWDLGFRAKRIVELIEDATAPIDIAYMQSIQGDNKDLSAEFMLPLLLELPAHDSRIKSAQDLLADWDYQNFMDSSAAALYAVIWKNTLALTFEDQLPEDYWPEGGSRWFEVMRNLVKEPSSWWWDKLSTFGIEDRDMILSQALSSAVQELETSQGKNLSNWNWGDLHLATFKNQSLGESGIAPIEALFNRGPFRTSGGESIVNAVGWSAQDPFLVDWLPSMRMIIDLSDFDQSLTIHTTGQSGHAFHPNYIDMADLWRTIQFHPMLWKRSVVEQNSKANLRLIP